MSIEQLQQRPHQRPATTSWSGLAYQQLKHRLIMLDIRRAQYSSKPSPPETPNGPRWTPEHVSSFENATHLVL